jgi:uncharacterized membrane protein YeaQ/YmgE (transglycosylase-associated protein family)
MAALQPIFDVIFRLEGFEAVAFWVALIVVMALCGYFIDMMMQGQGFGPFRNSLIALAGTIAGLYIRFNFIHGLTPHLYEPYVSIGVVLLSITALVLAVGYVSNRTS